MTFKAVKSRFALILAFIMTAGIISGCSSTSTEGDSLTVYSGQHEEFMEPIFEAFTAETGIKLDVRYGDSAALAAQILEEGENSPADVFLSQDAGSLGAVSAAGIIRELSADLLKRVPSIYQSVTKDWVGITGRARVFAYAPDRVTSLPTSIDDLVTKSWNGRVGIAPTNGSFQAFVSAMIQERGAAATETWLQGIKNNNPKIYEKNSQIVEAVDAGQIDLGLVNHYYVWEVSEELGRDINAKIGFFQPGDMGNLINVSGGSILKQSKKESLANQLLAYLLSDEVQKSYVTDTHEYSLVFADLKPADLPALSEIKAPAIDLSTLAGLKATQELLVKVGLI